MLHIPFGTAFFLRSDVPHSGCFGYRGNIFLHCAFQCEDNIGEDQWLFYIDPEVVKDKKLGDQKLLIYS